MSDVVGQSSSSKSKENSQWLFVFLIAVAAFISDLLWKKYKIQIFNTLFIVILLGLIPSVLIIFHLARSNLKPRLRDVTFMFGLLLTLTINLLIAAFSIYKPSQQLSILEDTPFSGIVHSTQFFGMFFVFMTVILTTAMNWVTLIAQKSMIKEKELCGLTRHLWEVRFIILGIILLTTSLAYFYGIGLEIKLKDIEAISIISNYFN